VADDKAAAVLVLVLLEIRDEARDLEKQALSDYYWWTHPISLLAAVAFAWWRWESDPRACGESGAAFGRE
jgi:hypothetical protein